MKKIAIVLFAMMGFVSTANAQQDRASVPGDNNTVIVSVSSDNQTSSTIQFYNNSTKKIEVCVSIYNDQNSKVGEGCYIVPAAPEQGSHSTSTETVSKIQPCRVTTSGCEAKRIKITSVKVKN